MKLCAMHVVNILLDNVTDRFFENDSDYESDHLITKTTKSTKMLLTVSTNDVHFDYGDSDDDKNYNKTAKLCCF